MSDALIRSVNPQNLGDTLNFLLTSKEPYKNLTNIDLKNADISTKNAVNSYIIEVFNKYLNVPLSLNVGSTNSTNLQPGDIAFLENRYYLITQVLNNQYITWPRSQGGDLKYFSDGFGIKEYSFIRPDISNIKNEVLKSIDSIAREIVSSDPSLQELFTEDEQIFNFDVVDKNLGDGFLQIGDLIFIVDPTQIAFNTQNGYQYFPTVRTAGNPKIPTIHQVKNVSLSLIFPNQDSINYQLLNLYAMFKRTPFVNLRNKDICSFFSDVCFGDSWPQQWLSIGLESIQIQSVNGFPNTLQANITILPFDYRIVSNGFEALLSIADVKKQQAILYKNRELDSLIRKSEAKLNEQSIVPERFLDVVSQDIKKSPDFRQSLPFRAFYQSIINNREFVKDENGINIKVSSSINKNIDVGYSIVKYRPKNKEFMLNEYDSESNKTEIILSYKFLNDSFIDVTKQISKNRTEYQTKTIEELNKIKDAIQSKDGLVSEILSSFYTSDDFFKQVNYNLNQKVNVTRELLSRYNITIDEESGDFRPVEDLFGLIWRGLLSVQALETYSSTIRDIDRLKNKKFSKDDIDPLSLLNGVIYYSNENLGIDNSNGVTTAQAAVDKIWAYLDTDTKKSKFAAFLHDMRLNLLNELGVTNKGSTIVISENEENPFDVINLPISEEKIIIDNKKDIITGWSLVFSNKFIPINLQAFKYPYYQHIGSEDAVLSLNITSTSEKGLTDFKSQLSLLSERLYESIKIITLTAPELISYIDGSINVDTSPNNIFKVFGINKVVFDNSTTSNITNHPNSWNTTLSLTQSNLTIDKYHSVETVTSNNLIREIISKILAGIEIDGNKFIIKKYKIRSTVPLSEVQDSPSWEDASLDTILKYKFIKSDWGALLLEYIKDIRTKGSELLNQRIKQKKVLTKSLLQGSNFYFSTGFTDESESTSENLITGENISAQYEKTDQEYKDIINPFIEITTDEDATNTINELCIMYPEFNKILSFIVLKLDSIFQQEYNTLTTLLKPNSGFLQDLIKNFQNTLNSKYVKLWGAAILTNLIFGNTIIANALGIAGVGFSFIDSVADASQKFGMNKIINIFSSSFTNILSNYNTTVVIELANRILKDPIIKDKFLTDKIIGTAARNLIENNETNYRINCYNDFDVPYLGESLALSPDFYLYNNTLNDFEILSYFNESTERYAKIGKLTLMMTLVEAEDALKKYNDILQQNLEINQELKEKADSVIFKSLGFGDEIESVITKLQDTQVSISRASDNIDEMDTQSFIDIITDWEKQYPRSEAVNKEEWDMYHSSLLNHLKKSKNGLSVGNLDAKKINLIYTARMKTLIELFEIYTIINKYMIDKLASGKESYKIFNEQNDISSTKKLLSFSKKESEADSIKLLYEHITMTLRNAENLTSQTLQAGTFENKNNQDNEMIKSLATKVGDNKGLASHTNKNFISLPDIKILQSVLYNKIGYYIRLNTFLNEYSKNPESIKYNFDTLPELKFLEFWNFRAVEENQRKLNILKEFFDGYSTKKDTTIKMFPTFKLFFLEEDKSFFRNFDDYYTHNAIQSIEIVSNKNSASTTAIIRLSNVTNTLTDQMSFLREKTEINNNIINPNVNPDNLFFGTLDIKPGTQIVIKLGYAPFDNLLKTAFQGRIIEMNTGPVCELVCQSYSSQLNHHIVSEKFGVVSLVKEHGDVASAILDMIPGLEKMGKISMFGLTSQDFSGKNLRNVRGKFTDKFLMGNLLGSVSSLIYAQDNPRDSNIYLPYTFTTSVYNRPTFDWVIFDQSVWDALQELTLYHRNVIATVRNFNDDPLSNRNEIRETLVIGDKGGFFKYTDSFSLSTLNIRDVEKAIENWNRVKTIFSTQTDPFYTNKSKIEGRGTVNFTTSQNWNLKNEYKHVFNFLQDELNGLVLSSIILDYNQAVPANPNILDLVVSQITNNRFFPNNFSTTIENIIKFSKFSKIKEEDILQTNFSTGIDLNDQGQIFKKVVEGIYELYSQNKIPLDITPEKYYQVKAQVQNTDQKLLNNPQYKKIQQHHLITDTSDIISNEISLNTQFANMVNVYYTKEPTINTANINNLDFSKDLSIWPVKAFGDTRDEHTRVLNSYQKNIDTNWFDTTDSVVNFFTGYKRINNKENTLDTLKGADGSVYSFNEKIPNWNIFPSFVVVGVNLLRKQVETMYQGTLEIIGNPNIQPYDIIHLQDYTNDMHGAIEVEEVIHIFTPEKGFRTILTPNLITYDRDPIQMQDVQIINQIYDFATARRNWDLAAGIGGTAISAGVTLTLAQAAPIIGTVAGAAGTAFSLWNGIVGSYKRHHKFLYDQIGNILGRDCINFTSLLYHGLPYMAGFDGVDYTNLKTLMNHNVLGVKNPITRFATFNDPLLANIVTNFNPNEFSLISSLARTPIIGGLFVPIDGSNL